MHSRPQRIAAIEFNKKITDDSRVEFALTSVGDGLGCYCWVVVDDEFCYCLFLLLGFGFCFVDGVLPIFQKLMNPNGF
ncbi:transmembrane protein, putative [Medicago truncatula]|uniref:Transmembrane protein, putative n=1 Tax=Medicago truncatula TaxID=3880 RepID=A0A072UN18_MEDTR|nr:transmembrane protein, putative [Medicago truncatula]